MMNYKILRGNSDTKLISHPFLLHDVDEPDPFIIARSYGDWLPI